MPPPKEGVQHTSKMLMSLSPSVFGEQNIDFKNHYPGLEIYSLKTDPLKTLATDKKIDKINKVSDV